MTAPGEWQLHWSVAGIWGRWPGTLAVKDGSVFRGTQSITFFVQRGKPWTLVTLARECDFGALPGWTPGQADAPVPTVERGGQFGRRRLSRCDRGYEQGPALGTHVANASTAGSTCPPSNVKGCYQLTYTVSRVG